MEITLDWLRKQNACSEGVTWWECCGAHDGAAVVRLLLAADFAGAAAWANWLIVRLLDRPGRIRYAINAAESVLDRTGGGRPQAEAAIAAAKAVLVNDTPKNRADAVAASWAVSAAADAAEAAFRRGIQAAEAENKEAR